MGYNNCDVIIFSKGAKINTTFLLCLLVFKNSVTHSTKIDLFSCRDKIGKKVFNFLVKKKVSIFLEGRDMTILGQIGGAQNSSQTIFFNGRRTLLSIFSKFRRTTTQYFYLIFGAKNSAHFHDFL